MKSIPNQISKLEREIRKQKIALARLRKKSPQTPIADYALMNSNGKKVLLSELFGKKDELILIHNMGVSCAYCTLWADGFNGMLGHLEDRAAFAVESPDSPATQRGFAKKRGWKFKFVSSAKTRFRDDLGFGDEDSPIPGASTFRRDKAGRIYHVNRTVFGPGDNYCALWDLFDLLPKGVNGWGAKLRYR